ncbi:MAG: response regulator [Nitrospirae bacterium]|nr:response regulator [Nitrospirota bacterium]
MKVLIVDDFGSIRKILGQMLRQMGHETIEAIHGKDAMAKLEVHPDIGLIMLDWDMPEMNGIQVLEALKLLRDKMAQRPTVVMVTTNNQMEKIVHAMTKGANEYIMKPFTKEILEEKLALLGITGGSRA